MKKNEFRISEVPPGSVLLMGDVAVFSVEGGFCATQARCTHGQGPLSEGTFDGSTVPCPLHSSLIQSADGRHAARPGVGAETYRVMVDGEVGRADGPLALAVQSE